MKTILKISDAVSLALHATVLLASIQAKRLSNRQIASELRASEAHLSKVLQRLAKVGLVKSIRGPKGGFMLGKPNEKISLLDVYEAIEGPLFSTHCLLDIKICGERKCIFGGLLKKVDMQAHDYLSSTSLADIKDVYACNDTEFHNGECN